MKTKTEEGYWSVETPNRKRCNRKGKGKAMSPNGGLYGDVDAYREEATVAHRRADKLRHKLKQVKSNRDDLHKALKRALELMNSKIIKDNPVWAKQAKAALATEEKRK